jgi:hypothetical protein
MVHTSEDELREVPLWRANKGTWPPGVREIRVEEADCLGVDRHGNLYWDGKPVEVRHIWLSLLLTRWQQVGAVIVVVSALFGALGAPRGGWRTRTGLVALVG